jgi:hypothetical protein
METNDVSNHAANGCPISGSRMDAGDFYIWAIRNKSTGSRLIVFGNDVAKETEAFGVGRELVVCLSNSSAAGEQSRGQC